MLGGHRQCSHVFERQDGEDFLQQGVLQRADETPATRVLIERMGAGWVPAGTNVRICSDHPTWEPFAGLLKARFAVWVRMRGRRRLQLHSTKQSRPHTPPTHVFKMGDSNHDVSAGLVCGVQHAARSCFQLCVDCVRSVS